MLILNISRCDYIQILIENGLNKFTMFLFVCVDTLRHSQQFFSHIGTIYVPVNDLLSSWVEPALSSGNYGIKSLAKGQRTQMSCIC